MERNKNIVIFLTGCIKPDGMIFTDLQDPEIRKQQYISAIKFYLEISNKKILFVENSNSDISSYFKTEISEERIEIITFNGNNYNKNLGKGYGEMIIIEHALLNSHFLKDADFIFKITGRIKVLNIEDIIKQAENNHRKQVLVNLQKFLKYSDSKCWGACKDFFLKILINYKDSINDSKNIHFENALCKAVHSAVIEDYEFSFLNILPRYSGVSGSGNTKFNDSYIYWFPRFILHNIRLSLLRK